MRIAAIVGILVLGGTVAEAQPADGGEPETAVETAARVWLAALLDGKGVVAAPSKVVPLDYVLVLDRPAKACRGLKAGRVVSAKELAPLKNCLMATWKDLDPDRATPAGPSRAWDWPRTFDAFPRAERARMKAIAKDTTPVLIQYIGAGRVMDATLVVAKDGAIRGLFVDRGEFE